MAATRHAAASLKLDRADLPRPLYSRVRAPRRTEIQKCCRDEAPNPRLSRLARSATHTFAPRSGAVCRRVLFGAIVEEDTYCREIKDGKPHGAGEVNDWGEPEGYGMKVYASGNMYEGQWRAGQFAGVGTMHSATGDRYVGQWVAGKQQGQGSEHYPTGDKYEGEWVAGLSEGQGTYHSADGNTYEGEWVAGKQEGKGTYHFASGSRYEGEFVAGTREGQGTYHYATGEVEVGRYKADEPVGEGAKWSADRATAGRMRDDQCVEMISLEEAARIAERVGLPVPGASS